MRRHDLRRRFQKDKHAFLANQVAEKQCRERVTRGGRTLRKHRRLDAAGHHENPFRGQPTVEVEPLVFTHHDRGGPGHGFLDEPLHPWCRCCVEIEEAVGMRVQHRRHAEQRRDADQQPFFQEGIAVARHGQEQVIGFAPQSGPDQLQDHLPKITSLRGCTRSSSPTFLITVWSMNATSNRSGNADRISAWYVTLGPKYGGGKCPTTSSRSFRVSTESCYTRPPRKSRGGEEERPGQIFRGWLGAC